MPKTCACFGCTKRSNKTINVSFHKFPHDDPTLLMRWLNNLSRDSFLPTVNHSVCSDHFVKEDYVRGIHPRDDQDVTRHRLLEKAVPTVFPAQPEPALKQKHRQPRKPPKKRPLPDDTVSQPPEKRHATDVFLEHGYSKSSDLLEEELKETKRKLHDARKEVKGLKQKLRRREDTIKKRLKAARDQNMITQGQLDLLQLNFGDKAFLLMENELQLEGTDVHGLRYSDQLKQFAVTLHFYSAQAYDFLRKHLHLPHPATIRKWSSSINCEPGVLTDVIGHLEQMVKKNPFTKHRVLMLDAKTVGDLSGPETTTSKS